MTLMFMSSSRDKLTLLWQNSVRDISVGFRPPCWCPSRWVPAWRLHTNSYKFGWNISSDISCTKYSSDPNLGEGLCIFTSFHVPDSGRKLLNGFDFYFDQFWMAWHWKPAIDRIIYIQVRIFSFWHATNRLNVSALVLNYWQNKCKQTNQWWGYLDVPL